MRTRKAFTLVELLVVIAVIALLIGVLLPALSIARTSARKLQNSTQLRDLAIGLSAFGQNNGGYYPGLDSRGDLLGPAPRYSGTPAPEIAKGDAFEGWSNFGAPTSGDSASVRFAILLNEEYVVPDSLVSPGDPDAKPAKAGEDPDVDGAPMGQLNTFSPSPDKIPNFSYAMLELVPKVPTGAFSGFRFEEQRARYREWRETASFRAVLLVDRVLGSPYYSIWTENPGAQGEHNWAGTVVRNDGSTTFEDSHVIPDTRYGNMPVCNNDDIFTADDRDIDENVGCAYMLWN